MFNFKLEFHIEDSLVEQNYFKLFSWQKIVAQRGRLQPFLGNPSKTTQWIFSVKGVPPHSGRILGGEAT